MARPSIAVGYEPDFAPLTFRDGDAANGLVIEALRDAFARSGIAPSFTPVALPDHDAAIAAGRIEAVAFKAITPERSSVYDFSQPVATTGAAWFAFEAASADAPPPPGTRIATPARGPLHAALRLAYPEAAFVAVETYAEALRAVLDGRADRAALNFHIGHALANRDFPGRFTLPEAPFQRMHVCAAFARGAHAELMAALDAALAELRAEGALAAIERRCLGGGA